MYKNFKRRREWCSTVSFLITGKRNIALDVTERTLSYQLPNYLIIGKLIAIICLINNSPTDN